MATHVTRGNKMLSAEIDRVTSDRIDKICEGLGMSRSEFVRVAVQNSLPDAERAAWVMQFRATREAIKAAAKIVAKDPEEYQDIIDGLMRIEEAQDKRDKRRATTEESLSLWSETETA